MTPSPRWATVVFNVVACEPTVAGKLSCGVDDKVACSCVYEMSLPSPRRLHLRYNFRPPGVEHGASSPAAASSPGAAGVRPVNQMPHNLPKDSRRDINR